MNLRRAVFLDRDGVLNEPVLRDGRPYPPSGLDELILVPDAEASLARLKQQGFLLLVVTNQPDVRRGTSTQAAVEKINQYLADKLPLDEFFICYHDDSDRCDCRKPLPGLFTKAAAKHGIDLVNSYMIGDRWRDIDAGSAAGCRTILIDRHYHERKPEAEPDCVVESLAQACDWILH
ncbi:MAG TPA: HAD family hydrolase [Bryobacteraceae bacterium]|nr:HAD family hydrolase [Bryobacteraceae bacterium]